jgi:hypothetical protein
VNGDGQPTEGRFTVPVPLILHDTNLRAAKAALRAMLPGRGSSHLSEALAVALGFPTHSKLLWALQAESHLPPDIVTIDEFAFNARLRALGEQEAEPFTLIELMRSEAIPIRPYAEFKDGDVAGNDAQYALCSQFGFPLVTVRMARLYATLDWDCITVSPSDDDYLFGPDNGSAFTQALFARFQLRARGHQGNPAFLGSPFTGWVKKLMPGTARALAEDFFSMLYLPMREQKRRQAA